MALLAHRIVLHDLKRVSLSLKTLQCLHPGYRLLLPCQLSRVVSTFNSNDHQRVSIPHRIVLAAPSKLQPYLKLSRIDAPIGTWLLFWPCTWGLSLGSSGVPSLELIGLFGLGAFLMRGAGCTINDMWDKRIDAQVSRTKGRPLASNQLRLKEAIGWMGLQLSLSFLILLYLPAPCLSLGIASLGLVIIYPLAKRFTNWPQGILGLTFNTGILFGYTAAVGASMGYGALPWLNPAILTMYGGALAWTLLYDTIYAHQDREEDALLGLGSTARKFGDATKMWLTGFGSTMISALSVSGVLSDLSWPYFASLSIVASHLAWQIWTLDINNRENCSTRFKANRHLGWIICSGILGSHFLVPGPS